MNPVSGDQPCDNTFFCGWVSLLSASSARGQSSIELIAQEANIGRGHLTFEILSGN